MAEPSARTFVKEEEVKEEGKPSAQTSASVDPNTGQKKCVLAITLPPRPRSSTTPQQSQAQCIYSFNVLQRPLTYTSALTSVLQQQLDLVGYCNHAVQVTSWIADVPTVISNNNTLIPYGVTRVEYTIIGNPVPVAWTRVTFDTS